MSFDLEVFKERYAKWVVENLEDYRSGQIEKVMKHYPFVTFSDVPWTPLTGEPSEKTFAIITSGGMYLKDRQPPFDTESIHGDSSFREIPKTVQQSDVGFAHAHYDHSLAETDFNTIFPIERFLELEAEGLVGRVADTHYSFSYVNDVATLITESGAEVVRRLKAEAVDALFLVPV